MNIVAAVTAGDSNLLIPGRHGVFVDTQGQSWEAVLVKLVDNPISIRTAMFAPYKRFGRMITDQLEKLASSKDSALMSDASKSIDKLTADAQKEAKPFDIGRSMGIFAAIGLALGAIARRSPASRRRCSLWHGGSSPCCSWGSSCAYPAPPCSSRG